MNRSEQLVNGSSELLAASVIPLQANWYKAEYLNTQIFDYENDRTENLVRYHVQQGGIFTWGLVSMKITDSLIKKGIFQLESLEAILPNGVEVALVGEALKLNFNRMFLAKKEGCAFVELLVSDDQKSKCVSKEKLIHDEEGDLPPILIERKNLSYRLALVGDKKHKQIGNRITLARIENRGGEFRLVDYIPPIQKLVYSRKLAKMVSDVTENLSRKHNYLSKQLLGLSPMKTDLKTEWMIKDRIDAIFTMLPLLKLDLSCIHSHPYTLYRTLCSVAGRVSTISQSMAGPTLKPYKHHQIHQSFTGVIDFIQKTLSENIVEHFQTIPFEFSKKDFHYTLKLKPEWKSQPLLIGVETTSGVMAAEVAEWFFHCSIGSEKKMKEIRRKRLTGVGSQEVHNIPNLIPVGNIDLFQLDRESEYLVADDTLIIENVLDVHEKKSKVTKILLYLEKDQDL